jgi:hypothetical protein
VKKAKRLQHSGPASQVTFPAKQYISIYMERTMHLLNHFIIQISCKENNPLYKLGSPSGYYRK